MVRKLVFHAADAAHVIDDPRDLTMAMASLGLTGEAVPGEVDAFLAGEAFLSLLTFLGCSPHVEFAPADEAQRTTGRYCHVRYRFGGGMPEFRRAAEGPQPRCRKCRAPVPDWERMVRDWQAGRGGACECPQCGRAMSVPELNWRQAAGAGRWFLEIWNIHPQEAVPAEALIAELERVAGTPVRYFYE